MNEQGATAEGLRLAFGLLFTVRGLPLVYYGDEIAMPGGNDPENRRDFPGGWKEDPRDAFTSAGRNATENSVWNHVAKLARLRGSSEALRRGDTRLLHHGEQTLAFQRTAGRETLVVVFNNARTEQSLSFEADVAAGVRMRDLLNESMEVTAAGRRIELRMPARSMTILKAR